MRAPFAIAISLVVMLVLAMLISPASGQTPIPPEVTPEFWPLTFDPVVAAADPDAVSLIFEAPYECSVTFDDQAVVFRGIGVFDLATGARRFGFDGHNSQVDISFYHPRIFVRGKGLYDLNTGELLLEVESPGGYLSPVDDFLTEGSTVYDVRSGDVVFEAGEDVTALSANRWAWDPRWVLIHYQTARSIDQPPSGFVVLDLETGEPPAGQYEFMNRIGGRRATTVPDGSLVAISGDGLYEMATGEKRFALSEMHDLRLAENGDVLMGITVDNQLQLIDTQTGQMILQRDNVVWIPSFGRGGTRIGGFLLSPDNMTLLVPEYPEVRADGASSYLTLGAQLVDVATGQTVARLPAAEEYVFPWDGRYVQVVEQGVFDVATGQMVFATATYSIRVTPDGRFALLHENGALKIFDPQTWTLLHEIPGGWTFVGPEHDDWILGSGGLYDIETGQLAFPLDLERPSLGFTGQYVIDTGQSRCSIYRVPEAQE